MDAATDHIRQLATEYVLLVEQMRSGAYTDATEYRTLSSQRTLLHDDLIALTGVSARPAMYAHCRALLAGNRNEGDDADLAE